MNTNESGSDSSLIHSISIACTQGPKRVNSSFPPLRTECPPGTCICERQALLASPDADPRALRVLLLTREEEKRLLARLENLRDLADLRHMQQRLLEQLGVQVSIAPGLSEVRSMRGIAIEVAAQPGLCRKTRQGIPAAIRRGLEQRPEIAFALLHENDLFGLAP